MNDVRLKNPASFLPEANDGIQSIIKAVYKARVPRETLELVHLRVSQINGCYVCLDYGMQQAKKAGEKDERLYSLPVWREAPHFSDAERAALALAEAETRLADHPEAVSDEIWNDAAKHFDETGLAALVMWIALTNTFNRLNVTTRQVAPTW